METCPTTMIFGVDVLLGLALAWVVFSAVFATIYSVTRLFRTKRFAKALGKQFRAYSDYWEKLG